MDKCKKIKRPLQNISIHEIVMIREELSKVLTEKGYIYFIHFSHDKYYDCICVNIDIEGKIKEFTDDKQDIGYGTPVKYVDGPSPIRYVEEAVNSTLVEDDGSISNEQIEFILNEQV